MSRFASTIHWREKRTEWLKNILLAWTTDTAILTVKFAISVEIRLSPLYAKRMAATSPQAIVAILSLALCSNGAEVDRSANILSTAKTESFRCPKPYSQSRPKDSRQR